MAKKGNPNLSEPIKRNSKSEQPSNSTPEKSDVEQIRPEALQSLQRAVGNQAMNRLLGRGKKSASVQFKLTVGAANDAYEQEADRVADQVMRQPEPNAASGLNAVRRSPEEEELQTKRMPQVTPLVRRQPEDDEEIQTSSNRQAGLNSFEAGPDFESSLAASRGQGSPLPGEVRQFMEPRFGADFSQVRVHDDHQSADLNRSVMAQAFTHGMDIYMGEGRYNPGTSSGQRLLAHELTHVVQQNSQVARSTAQRSAPRLVKTISVINRAVIQRVPDDVTVQTDDLTHPALTHMNMTKLGPYKFDPMTGTFKYEPPDPGVGVKKFVLHLLKDKTAGPQYQPEETRFQSTTGYEWINPADQSKHTFHPTGVTPADPQDRIAKATKLYDTTSFEQGKQENVVGKVLDALKSHDKGKTPRSFHNISQEDSFGEAANAHIRARHVLGGEMADANDVAIRAAFGLVGGFAGKKAMYSKTASAFKTVADANMEIGMSIRDELIPNWNKYREELVINGVVNLKSARHGGQIVAYQSTIGKKYGVSERPAYLGAGTGHKPLYYPDARWDTWANTSALTADEKNEAKGNPLTEEVSGSMTRVQVRILSSEEAAHGGWFVHSAYPIF